MCAPYTSSIFAVWPPFQSCQLFPWLPRVPETPVPFLQKKGQTQIAFAQPSSPPAPATWCPCNPGPLQHSGGGRWLSGLAGVESCVQSIG